MSRNGKLDKIQIPSSDGGPNSNVDATEVKGSIHFPALWSGQRLVYMIDTLDTVSQCNKLGFRSGCYRGAALIDSNYRKFEVVDARKLRILFSLNFDSLFDILVGNPRWQVELVFGSTPKKSSLEEVKRL